MKVKSLIAGSVLAASTVASSAAMAETTLSANMGFMSDYFFRGVYQAESSASAGLDLGIGPGFYVGTWLADVNSGIEYDLYGGWATEFKGFSFDIGYYTYNYTDDFDDTYAEFLASVGYGPVSVSYASGTYDNFGGGDLDYDFLSATAEWKGAYVTYGTWGKDFDGDYWEVGYGTTVSNIDLGVALIMNSEELDLRGAGDGYDGETALTFNLGYSWDLM